LSAQKSNALGIGMSLFQIPAVLFRSKHILGKTLPTPNTASTILAFEFAELQKNQWKKSYKAD
jgi:hypothetical protein